MKGYIEYEVRDCNIYLYLALKKRKKRLELIMAKEELECDVIEKIIEELEETIETLERIKKKMKYFHAKTFRQT